MHWIFSSDIYVAVTVAAVDNMLYERLIIIWFIKKIRSNTIKIKINRTFLSLSLYARSWISAFILLCLLIPLALLTFFWMFSHILLFSFTSTLYEAKVLYFFFYFSYLHSQEIEKEQCDDYSYSKSSDDRMAHSRCCNNNNNIRPVF